MSGHNPHGHLSQPNSSWNPLQIPSYIPRQPQLAHMSNERPLVSSPLTWHTPTPPEALYSFISANHKNLELNPLLPPFVRGPAPFGSVDLTIQTARNNSTSPRHQTSPPPEFLHNKPNSCNNLSSSISPNPGVIQTTGSVRDKISSSNGSNGEASSTGSLFVRDARQINNEFVKIANRDQNETQLDSNEPVQLVKDATYHSVKIQPVPTSPKKSPSQKPPSVPGNAPTPPQPRSPVLPLQNATAAAEVTNHFASIMPLKSTNITNENSPICSAKSSPTNITSNEDSVDSVACKVRRKRKPNKTARVPNDSDESLSVNEQNTDPQIKSDYKNKSLEDIFAENTDCNFKTSYKEDSINCEIDKEALDFSAQMLVSEDKKNQNGSSTEMKSVNEDRVDFQKSDDNSSVIVDNRSHTEISFPEEKQVPVVENDSSLIKELDKQIVSGSQSPRKRSKRKGDSDDIETIDKIAAMIANTNENDSITNCTLQAIEQCEIENEKIETPQNSTIKVNDLTEILGEPITKETFTSQNNAEITTENYYEEVENKLEEMFAGIDDERPPCMEAPVIGSVERQVSLAVNCDLGLELPLVDKVVDQVKSATSSQKRPHSSNLDQNLPKKKMKTTKKCNNQKFNLKSKISPKTVILPEKKEKPREDFDTKYRGPLIHIKSDGLMTVINTPITEDEGDKNNKVKRIFHNHCNTERNKIRGMHISTLSTKYDADTADISWKCVFCKKGPHKLGLGDLFGPYIITTTCEEFDLSQKDPSEDEFVSKRTKAEMFQKQSSRMPVVPATTTLNFHCNLNNMKKKRKADPPNDANCELPEIFFGMSKVSDTSYEVWMHEDCAVWASGIHLVGARIVGLEAAVWSSTRQKCKICSYNGAVICCLQHGCSEKAHIPCARAESWSVMEGDFKIFCNNHSVLVS